MAEPNTHRPGLPDYVGQTEGIFLCVHHNVLAEYSWNIMERVADIRKNKPQREVQTRLYALLWLDPSEEPELDRAWAELDRATAELDRATAELNRAREEWDRASAEWDRATAEPELLAYLYRHIPDAPWRDGHLVVEER